MVAKQPHTLPPPAPSSPSSSPPHDGNKAPWSTSFSGSARAFIYTVGSTLSSFLIRRGLQSLPEILGPEDRVVLLGKTYGAGSLQDLHLDFACRPYFSYRYAFAPLGPKGYTSDSGWGCMVRVGQSLVCEGFIRLVIGRNIRPRDERPDLDRILGMFKDDPAHCFSIHSIASCGEFFGTEIGSWFGPTVLSLAVRKIALEHRLDADIVLAADSSVVTSNVLQALKRAACGVILLIPLRLGIKSVHDSYHPFIKIFFSSRFAIGIAGGLPSSAYFFVGLFNENLLLLDPHILQSHQKADANSFTSGNIQYLPIAQLDPSLCFGFAFKSLAEYAEWQDWVDALTRITTVPFNIQEKQTPKADMDALISDAESFADSSA